MLFSFFITYPAATRNGWRNKKGEQMEKQFVSDLKDRDAVDSIFMVKEKTLAVAKNGKPYMNLKFMDKSGDIDGKLWDNVDQLDKQFVKGDFVKVRGTGSLYMGKMQLVAKEIGRVDESAVNLADFVPVSPIPQEEMQVELAQFIGSITNRHLKQLMERFSNDSRFMAAYCKAPAAKGMHHVYIGGLLEHSLSVARLVDAVAPLYPALDRDLLLVGALLHDMGKVAELCYERAFEYSDEGRLLGHISIGLEMLTGKIGTIDNFPPGLAMLLKHLILSHHGEYEYGSPKRPKTLEATVLHYLDDMDSKINGISSHIAKETPKESHWTSHHRLYNLYFFSGSGMDDEEMLEDGGVIPAEPVTAEKPEPPAVTEKLDARKELTRGEKEKGKGEFANRPFATLENLDLFMER